MKKFISVILVMLILASSMFSVNAFAAEGISSDFLEIMSVEDLSDVMLSLSEETTENVDEDSSVETDEPEDDSEQVEEIKTRTDNWIEKMQECDEYSLNVSKKNSSATVQVFVKNDVVAAVISANSGSSQKIVIENDKRYVCSTSFPYYYYQTENTTGVSAELLFGMIIENLGKMTFVRSYEESGCYFEEYNSSRYGTMIFVFDGDNVTKIDFVGTNETAEFSYSVKDKDVNFPFLAIDLTPIIKFLAFILGAVYGI